VLCCWPQESLAKARGAGLALRVPSRACPRAESPLPASCAVHRRAEAIASARALVQGEILQILPYLPLFPCLVWSDGRNTFTPAVCGSPPPPRPRRGWWLGAHSPKGACESGSGQVAGILLFSLAPEASSASSIAALAD